MIFYLKLVLSIAFTFFLALKASKITERIAHFKPEPFGTMVLTLSAVSIEVILIAILISSGDNIFLARDSVYSAIVFDITGILGLSVLLGGWKHFEQKHNEDGINTYLTIIVTMCAMVLIMPSFIPVELKKQYSVFSAAMCVIVYLAFLYSQTKRHKSYFQYSIENSLNDEELHHLEKPTWVTYGQLFSCLLLVAITAEFLSHTIEHEKSFSISPAIIAIFVAIISASSEILTAVKSALKNNLQAAVNIAMGASVSTLLLTVPIIEVIAYVMNKEVEFGLSTTQIGVLGLTFISAHSLSDGETNFLEGFSLVVTFFCFVFFCFA